MRKIVLATMLFIFLYHGTLHAQAAPKENNAVAADSAILRWDPSLFFDQGFIFRYGGRMPRKLVLSTWQSEYKLSWIMNRWMHFFSNTSAQRRDRIFECYVRGYNIYLATNAGALKKTWADELIPGTYRVIHVGMTATPKNPEYTISGLAPGTYYFRVTAYDNCGESGFTDRMVSKKIVRK